MSAAIQRVLLVVNPGSRFGGRLMERAAAALDEAGVHYDILLTSVEGDAARAVAATASTYDAVFTLGGDGTVMEVLSALPEGGPPIGILHGGTANLIAQAIGVPRRIGPAVRALLTGSVVRIDLGRLNDGRRFALAAGVGLDAAMVVETPRRLKRRLGVLAYLIVGTRALLRFEEFAVRVQVDDAIHEQTASAVLVANFGTLLHHLFVLGDGIKQDDGLLNVCVFHPRTVRDAVRITRRLLMRDFTPDPCLWYASGRRIVVHTTPERPVQADGELLGHTPFSVDVEPLRGALLVPGPKRTPRNRGARRAAVAGGNQTRSGNGTRDRFSQEPDQ